jgi:dihydropteroate synthase
MAAQDTVFYINKTVRWGDKALDLSTPAVMGILNVTPDSFYDGGKYTGEEQLLEHAGRMIKEGAAIIDIGAASTRPGAPEVDEAEELARLLPAIKAVRKAFPHTIISADTWRAAAAEKAVEAGADIINDVSGGTMDERMFEAVGRLKVPYVLMHIKGTPKDMQADPRYNDVTAEVKQYLADRIEKLEKLGVTNIILDPGFGFGKTTEHNYTLLARLEELVSMGYPVLAGASRKSMINRVLGTKPESALNGTTAVNTIALMNGAHILRVHDVREAVQAVKIVEEYRRAGLEKNL